MKGRGKLSKNTKQNIGTINALTRITCGLFFLTYGAVKISRQPWNQKYWILVLASAMKVGEGIVRYCPVTDMAKKQTTSAIFGLLTKSRTENNNEQLATQS